MNAKDKRDKARLVATAKDIAAELRAAREGTALRVRSRKLTAKATTTDGWAMTVATLKGTHIEVWLDRYSGNQDRKYSMCFWNSKAAPIVGLVSKMPRELGKPRLLTDADWTNRPHAVVNKRLTKRDFDSLFEEHYKDYQSHFLTMNYWHRATNALVDAQFCDAALSFIVDIARSQPGVRGKDPADRAAYPRNENRKLVKAHLSRERSSFLATECKRRDSYVCQVCSKTLVDRYGDLGEGFAESHHIRPLKLAANKKRTRLEELVTVCANCHRMLHRMDGVPDDLRKLRALVNRYGG